MLIHFFRAENDQLCRSQSWSRLFLPGARFGSRTLDFRSRIIKWRLRNTATSTQTQSNVRVTSREWDPNPHGSAVIFNPETEFRHRFFLKRTKFPTTNNILVIFWTGTVPVHLLRKYRNGLYLYPVRFPDYFGHKFTGSTLSHKNEKNH